MPRSLPPVEIIVAKIQAAIYGMYIGDALAMPVHWYYDRNRIYQDFGKNGITKYEKSVASGKFAGSIMNLSNTGGGGRGSDSASIIGDVLVKGKKDYWLRGGNNHYHVGMAPGENTLDTLVARLMLQTLIENPDWRDLQAKYNEWHGTSSTNNSMFPAGSLQKNPFTESFLNKYIPYMTTKDSHNDVYVATAHRMFFANQVKGIDPFKCADNDGHNTDSIDGLINVGIVTLNQIIMEKKKSVVKSDGESDVIQSDAVEVVKKSLTSVTFHSVISDSINVLRKSIDLPAFGNVYNALLVKLIIENKELRTAIEELCDEFPRFVGGLNKNTLRQFASTSKTDDDPMSACYVKSNFPVTLLLAYKYYDSIEKALLASANAGGENVNRSAILGTIMGAALGETSQGKQEIQKWSNGLVYGPKIIPEVAAFVQPINNTGGKSEL